MTLLADYATEPRSATTLALALVESIEADPDVRRDVLLTTADRRDPAVRAKRAQCALIISRVLTCCYAELLGDPSGRSLLQREQRRQELGLTFAANARSNAVERAAVCLSDWLAQVVAPCHRTAISHRRSGLCRRPDSGLPIFTPAHPIGRCGAFFPDVDRLQWVWVDLTTLHLVDGDGEEYDMAIPTSDVAEPGVVSYARFCLWRSRPLAVRYKSGERKVVRRGTRIVREDEAVVGLHESSDGTLLVDLRRHLLDEIDRRTGLWSACARDAQLQRKAARGAPLPARSTDARPTRTEGLVEQLRHEGANVEFLRQLWAAQITEERRLGLYA
jgi:hypothetical protein